MTRNEQEHEQREMERYGITVEQTSIFLFKGHRYARLEDALNYARIEATREHTADAKSP